MRLNLALGLRDDACHPKQNQHINKITFPISHSTHTPPQSGHVGSALSSGFSVKVIWAAAAGLGGAGMKDGALLGLYSAGVCSRDSDKRGERSDNPSQTVELSRYTLAARAV